jgi:hypothetical protein
MPSKHLVAVHGYFDPEVFEVMEEVRKGLRRITKSRFIEDAVIEKLERLGKFPPARPTHEGHRRKHKAA